MSGTLNFTGRVALITGAGAGLGAAYARWLAARGARVVVNNRCHEGRSSTAQAVVDQIRADGGEAVANDCAVEHAESGAAMVDCALDTFGRLDIVVANAAVGDARPIEETSPEFYRRSMDINFFGAIYPVLAALPRMRAANYGRIVVTTSATALFGARNLTAYAASKMALVGFARALSVELAKTDVRINTISPYARTKMSSTVLGEHLESVMSPDWVAPVVGWLCSEACNRSGIILSAGAGRVRRAAIVESPGTTLDQDGVFDWEPLDDLAHAIESRDSRWSSTALIPELLARAAP